MNHVDWIDTRFAIQRITNKTGSKVCLAAEDEKKQEVKNPDLQFHRFRKKEQTDMVF